MSSKRTDTRFWDERRNLIRTKKGGWHIGKNIKIHGYDLLKDLAGRTTFFQTLVLNITGRLPEKRLADWMEVAFLCMSYPDPRIWCNQIGSLGGTVRTTPVASTSAGIMASDSKLYGPGIIVSTVNFLKNVHKKQTLGETLPAIIEHAYPRVPGFSRPIARGDERIEVMENITAKYGFSKGKWLTLAYDIQAILEDKTGESLNIAGYIAAFMSDQGFSEKEIYRIGSTIVHAGVAACYAEAYDNPPESFLPLRCEDIDYQGRPPRPLRRPKDSKTS
ncbi:MAG: hypothetical protein D6819_06790 [Gammaproteobacteria bacterium]|nr:MAG: hypothetical protein D6819_06790 [Gammaproteobacteria bacterium]